MTETDFTEGYDTREQLEERLADIRRKLAARENQLGYSDNVKDLKKAIAQCEAKLAALG